MPKKVFEIQVTDGKHWYRLTYTTAPKTSIKEFIRHGWKQGQLRAVRIRNPGAAWHKKEREEAEAMVLRLPVTKRKYYLGKAHAHGKSQYKSLDLGMPNPKKKHKTRKKSTLVPVLVIGGILVALFLVNEV